MEPFITPNTIVGKYSLLKTEYSWRRTIVVVTILLLSIADAFMTLEILKRGGAELNPIMELAINQGVTFFISLKYMLTATGLLILFVLKQKKAAKNALISFLLFYIALLFLHVTIL